MSASEEYIQYTADCECGLRNYYCVHIDVEYVFYCHNCKKELITNIKTRNVEELNYDFMKELRAL